MPTEDRPRKGPTNPLDQLIGYHLRRAANAMLADLGRRVEPFGLTLTEMSVLQLVAANPKIRQSDLGRLLAIQRANMTPLIAGMETRGWLSREAIDGRSQGLILTIAGEELLGGLRSCIDENEAWLVRNIAPVDRSGLIEALRQIWS